MDQKDPGSVPQPAGETEPSAAPTQSTRVLMLGALGVVYGDIGTSPIYAFREALHAASADEAATRIEVLGVLSLIVWALTVIVTIIIAMILEGFDYLWAALSSLVYNV